jgi:hypothetical protein
MTTTEQRDFNSYTCTVCGQEVGSMGHGEEPCPGPAKKVKILASDFEKTELMLKKSWMEYVVEPSQMTEGGKCIVVYNEVDNVQIEFYFNKNGKMEYLTSFEMEEADGVEFDVKTAPEEAKHEG